MSQASACKMSASYNFVAVDFLTWTCGKPKNIDNVLKTFVQSEGTF